MKPPKTKGSTKPKQRKRVGRLKTAGDVAKYIARTIKAAERGEGEANTAYKLVMMASMLLKAVEVATLEERINKLENSVKGELK